MSKSLPVLQSAEPEPPIQLPTLNEANLDWEELDCVLADLDDFAIVLSIIAKEAGNENTPRDKRIATIASARDLLVAGDVVALQVRYEFADQTWFDTYLREPTGARLVRMPEQT
tara:strand:- start:70976 stop:71317 length:342 start_codon:yes stop_codon:yes gene_type:complete